MSWHHVLTSCHDIMSWHHVLTSGRDIMSWHHVLTSCLDIMSWHHVLTSCLDIMSWHHVLTSCLDTMTWCHRTSVCTTSSIPPSDITYFCLFVAVAFHTGFLLLVSSAIDIFYRLEGASVFYNELPMDKKCGFQSWYKSYYLWSPKQYDLDMSESICLSQYVWVTVYHSCQLCETALDHMNNSTHNSPESQLTRLTIHQSHNSPTHNSPDSQLTRLTTHETHNSPDTQLTSE